MEVIRRKIKHHEMEWRHNGRWNAALQVRYEAFIIRFPLPLPLPPPAIGPIREADGSVATASKFRDPNTEKRPVPPG